MPRKLHNITDWVTDSQLLRIQHWTMHGANKEEVATNMGISRRTLNRWLDDPRYGPSIKQAMSLGTEVAVASIENALFRKAQNGDLGSMCFFLKNRAPDKWSEHPELRGFDGRVVFVDDIPKEAAPAPAQPETEGDQADKPDNS